MTKLSNDQPRNATTDPESGMRYYTWQGQKLISVTTARRAAGMPFGLHNWALNQVVNYVIANVDDIALALDEPTPGNLVTLKHDIRAAATAERDAAAAIGTAVHDAASRNLDPATVDPVIRPRLLQFMNWLETSKATVLASEFQVYNLTAGYGGTIDLLVQMPNDTIWLIDLKTGKGVYAEHALQVVAYARSEFSGRHMCQDRGCRDPEHDVVDDALTELLGLIDGTAILHLSDDGWEFRVIPNSDETFTAYLGLLTFGQFMSDHATAESITSAMKSGKAVVEEPAWEPELEAALDADPGEEPPELAIDATPDPVEAQEATQGAVEGTGAGVDVTAEARAIFEGDIASIGGVKLLTREEFMAAVRFVEMPTNLLLTTAHNLFPGITDMRMLDDEQRGLLFAAADTAWVATA